MNRKCEQCGQNEGKVHYKGTIGNQSSEQFLCVECAQKKSAAWDNPTGSSFLDIIGNIFGQPNEEPFSSQSQPQPNMTKTRNAFRSGELDKYCRNLNEEAENGSIDPIIGRDKEIERTIQVLNLRKKNNPVLIGEPGVGKTAIAEGLALRITQGNVPEKLLHKQIYSLDVTAVTAGTMYRGMFEERMKKILKEVKSRNDVILFIDEVHMIMGAGSAMDSNLDVANIIKPDLASGKIQLIGATTLEEYREIEKDAALARRFQIVKVDEPSIEDTIQILQGLQPEYEKCHGVTYSEEAIQACAKLADRYLSERFMPDKAIDLMDEVGSRINLQPSSYSKELASISKNMQKCIDEQNFEKASYYKVRLAELLEEQARNESSKQTKTVVKSDVERIVEDITGIPVTKLAEEDKKGLATLEERLNNAVIGQTKAVQEVVRAVKRNRFNLRKKKKPTVLFFAGPTGVGKTELSKQLAKELFGDKRNIVRYDMSEFKESHAISKLIGSPPGYVGHEKGGSLTEKIRRKPYSVILLDEFEKAHKEIQHVFLQVFDEGRLTDSHDKTVDFSNTVIIMTSNLGATAPKKVGLLAESPKQFYNTAIQAHFAPEFINRIDSIVTFDILKQDDMMKIVDLQLVDLVESLQEEKGITLGITESAKKWLVEKGYNENLGARPLSRTITREVDDRITELLLSNQNNSLANIVVDVKENELTLTV